jgi:hypothetical protein
MGVNALGGRAQDLYVHVRHLFALDTGMIDSAAPTDPSWM